MKHIKKIYFESWLFVFIFSLGVGLEACKSDVRRKKVRSCLKISFEKIRKFTIHTNQHVERHYVSKMNEAKQFTFNINKIKVGNLFYPTPKRDVFPQEKRMNEIYLWRLEKCSLLKVVDRK